MGGYVFGFIGAVVLPVSTVGSIVLFVLGDLSVALEIFFAGLIIGLLAIVVAHLQRMSTYTVVAYGKLVGNLEKVLEKAQRLSVLKRELGSYSLDFPRVRAL